MAASGKRVTPTKSASLVYFHYGDSPFLSICQETLRVRLAFEGSDFNVLLKEQTTPAVLDFNEADEKRTNVLDLPTRKNFLKYLHQLARDGYRIDVWIFAHGNRDLIAASDGDLRASEIASELAPARTGLAEMPIRLVYGTNCYGSTLGGVWTSVGAKVAAGARFVNFFPHQFGAFAKEWNAGTSFGTALGKANTTVSRRLTEPFILVDAGKMAALWGGCPGLAKTVLNTEECARRYFGTRWGRKPDELAKIADPREHMKRSSEQAVAGKAELRKRDSLTWRA